MSGVNRPPREEMALPGWITRAGALVLLLVVVAACGSRVPLDEVSGPDTAALADVRDAGPGDVRPESPDEEEVAAGDGSSGSHGQTLDEPAPPETNEGGGAEAEDEVEYEPWPEVHYGPRHNIDEFTITLSSDCVRQGDLLTVMLQGPPNAGVSMVIAYADRRPHGNSKGLGESDADGRYVWRVVVAPTAPRGEAKVLASTTGAGWEGESASADRFFTVARRC